MNPEIIDFINWLVKSDWYLDEENLWRQYGYSNKTTKQLFQYWKEYFKN